MNSAQEGIPFIVSLCGWYRGGRGTAPNKARQTGAFILCMFILLPLLSSRGTINIDQNQTAHSYGTAQKYATHKVKRRQSCKLEEERTDWTRRQIRERKREHFKEKRERERERETEAECERGRKELLMRGRARLVCLPPRHEESGKWTTSGQREMTGAYTWCVGGKRWKGWFRVRGDRGERDVEKKQNNYHIFFSFYVLS